MIRKLSTLIVAAVCLSGCAFTVSDVPLNYEYSGVAAVPAATLPSISVGDFTDVRDVDNPRMIMNKGNLNGQTTTGGWQAEKDLTSIVRDALVKGVARLNTSEQKGSIELTGELLDVDDEIITGMWTGTLAIQVQLKLTAKDSNSGEILWRDTLFGEGKSEGGSWENVIRESFNGALDDLVDKLLSDEYFLQQTTKSTPPANLI